MIAFLGGVQSTIIFIIFLSILIVVHEWGHFITAKKLGIRVDEFALGFGPTLWAKMYNGTNYMIKAFPLGGYVRMAGDEREKCTGAPDEFYAKSPGARALVVFNGPMVNFVLAYVSLVLVFMLGYPGFSSTVTEVKADGPAVTSGILPQDKIVAINGRKIYGWMHLDRLLEGTDGSVMTLTVERNGQLIDAKIKPEVEERPDLLEIPTYYRNIGLGFLSNKIGGVVEGDPADKAGLQMDDVVLEIDGTPITNWTTLHQTISGAEGDTITLKYLRDGKEYVKEIVPKIKERTDEDGNKKLVKMIGVAPIRDFEMFKFSFIDSLIYSAEELWYVTSLTYEALYRMVTGTMDAKESVTGPVGIFIIVKTAAEAGLSHLLFILAIISASLAIFNLLPMLPLDGGHLFLLGLEQIRGKPLPVKYDEFVARMGFTFIILLAVYVFYTDFARIGWIDGVKNFVTELIN